MSEVQVAPRRRPGRRLAGALGVWVLLAVGLRAIVLQPEHCGAVDPVAVRAAAGEAVDWLGGNQRDDGEYLYRYDRDDDVDLGGYNIVRHAGVTMSLYQAHRAGLPGALAAADRGTRWAVDRFVDAGGGRAFARGSSVPVGASALLAAGLAERRLATGAADFDAELLDLGVFLSGSVEPSGAVSASWSPDRGDYDRGRHSIFFTGEVYWALALVHGVFPDEGFDAAAARIEAYLATSRDDAEDLFPPPSDHWAAYGLATRYADAAAPGPPGDYVSRQAGLFGAQVRYESQRTNSTWSWITRGRQTLGAGLGTLGEGLGNLWWVAGEDEREAVAERARCVAGMLIDRQADGDDPAERGAWFQFGVTQMDDQQHAMSALLLTLPILEAGQTTGEDP